MIKAAVPTKRPSGFWPPDEVIEGLGEGGTEGEYTASRRDAWSAASLPQTTRDGQQTGAEQRQGAGFRNRNESPGVPFRVWVRPFIHSHEIGHSQAAALCAAEERRSVDNTKPGTGGSPGRSGGTPFGTPAPVNKNASKWSVIVHPVGTGVASVKPGTSALANVSVAMM